MIWACVEGKSPSLIIRKRFTRAIHLLRRAREIDPWSFEAVLQLARLLSKTDQGEEASMLLQGLALPCG